jgi:hypothetical protein
MGKNDIKELQTTKIFGIEHILPKVIMYEYITFVVGNTTTFTVYCNYKIATIFYIIKNRTFSIYI